MKSDCRLHFHQIIYLHAVVDGAFEFLQVRKITFETGVWTSKFLGRWAQVNYRQNIMEVFFCFWCVTCGIVTDETAQRSLVGALVHSHESLEVAIPCVIVDCSEADVRENGGV